MANEKMKPQSPEEIARAAQEAALEQMRAMMGSIPGMPDMGDMQAQIMAQMQAAVPDLAEIQAQQAAMGTLGGVDAAAVFKASDIARQALTIVSEHNDRGCRAALRLIEDSDRDHAYVLNSRKRLLGVVSSQSLREALHGRQGALGLHHAFLPNAQPLDAATPVADLFGPMSSAPCPLPVVDEDGIYQGVISRTTLMKFLDRDTPPVPPPQAEVPPIQLNPHFPAQASTPVAAPR